MNNTKFVFLFFLSSLTCHSVKAQEMQKTIMTESLICQNYSSVESNSILITKNENGVQKIDTCPVSNILTNNKGALYGNPLSWDVLDSFLFVIRTYEDSYGMNFTELRKYNLFEITRLSNLNKDSLINYLLSIPTIISKPIDPLEKYSSIIAYDRDKITGRIYFDISCAKNELNVYVYIESKNTMEVWNYTRFPIYNNSINIDNKDKVSEIYKHKPWEVVSSTLLDKKLLSPFKIINSKEKKYILDYNGNIFYIDNDQIISTPQKTNNAIIIDKYLGEVFDGGKHILISSDGRPLRDKLRESAIQILNDH